MATKKFRLIDVVLSVICVVFVAEAITPAAAIGNAQFFWWIFLIVTFLIPYGLIVSELGTAYSEDEGGLYDWIRRAYGDTWASRVAWWYWINFSIWMASLAVLFPETIIALTGSELGIVPSLLIELVFIWVVVFISFSRASDSIWIMNIAALLKVGIALAIGGLGIYFATQNGFASDMSPKTFLPSLDPSALTYISIILFNFMGFEVVATYASDMENPKVQIPKAIVAGGVAIAAIYMISSFGISAAIPLSELSLESGILDAVAAMTGGIGALAVVIMGVFLVTLFGNMVSWSFGVNFVAVCAAKDHNLPEVFGGVTKKTAMPKGVNILNGVVASVLVALIPAARALGVEQFFWVLFSVSVVFLLLSYIPMFPAFIKLRRVDAATTRIFKVPGSKAIVNVFVWLPIALLLIALVMTLIPFNGSQEEMAKIPGLIVTLVFLAFGEAVRIYAARSRKRPYRGMDYDGVPPVRELEVAASGE
ncbi:APC family permease [Corynebacterium hindlerae]|uniref:APC family permease n=1 Tax=Corynebacterium hindlerae TaxID=699041 RepID=UPI0031B6FD0C